MDNNWRAAQGQIAPQGQVGGGEVTNVGTPGSMDTGDWRNQLQADSRQRIVNKIMDTLTRHLPFSGQEGLQELKKIAIRFEEKIYTAATSQSDYLRKISMKMLTMETKSQNPLQQNGVNTGQNSSDQVQGMQTQVQNQQLSGPGQSQSRQQLMSQNMAVPGLQNSASLASALPNSVNLTQSAMTNVMSQNSTLQNMQNMPNVAQNTMGNSIGPGMASNVFTNSQRLLSGRQQVVPQQQQQQQQQSQNAQTYLYQQQFQNQLIKQKYPQGGMAHSLMPQQNLIHPNQMQTSQQGGVQSSAIQSSPLSSIQQSQQPSVQPVTQPVLQSQSQSVLRQQQHHQQQQTSLVHQQQSSISQQTLVQAPQQQQQHQMIGQQQGNAAGIQHNQMIGQANSIPDVQQQQQQRLMAQQSNVPNLQQQLMNQQNSLSNMQQQQIGPQGNVSGLHQQSVLGSQTGNAGMQTNQQNMLMLQQSKVPVQQHMQQNGMSLLPNQNQLSQQASQQQMVSHIQSQPVPPQHLLQQSNPIQREGQQRLPTSGTMLQQQNVEQQKQLYQSQRVNPEASSNSLDSTAQTGNVNGGDWQEEVYQKIKSMKDMYFVDLNDMLMKISSKLQQHDSQPQQPRSEPLEKLRYFKVMLDRLVGFLRTNRSEIQINHREKWPAVEKQIINILNSNRPRRTGPLQGQHPQPQMSAVQLGQPQAQLSHMPPQDNQMNPQMQPINLQSSISMQPNSLTNLQHSMPVSSSQQNMMSGVQPGSTLEMGQNNALNQLQQVAVTSLQANSIGSPQTVNLNSLSSQNGMNTLQSNLGNSLQINSNLNQNQHIKQEQQTLPTQQLKQQMQQRQMHQMLARQQQLMQQQPHHQHQQQSQQHQQQQVKQQHPAQLSGHQMSPPHQMTDSGDVKVRQQMGVKPAVFQQHHPNGQRTAYHHQIKSGSPFPVSPPQVLQAHSPQVPPHHSPQIEQQNMLTTTTKAGTPLQSASSPFVVPSPSTPLAPSPMPGESEKLNSSLSLLSNNGNMGHSQVPTVGTAAQSLAIGTPGISASPLLAEFSSLDGAHVNTSTAVSSKLNVVEQPLERLMRAVKSITHTTLAASVRDISSVVSMVDRIAGSAPGNGSRAAVGEDLVAMTKCRLQARIFFTQDGPSGTKRMRRSTSAMPSDTVSSVSSLHDSVKQLNGSDTFELESTATSSIQRSRIEPNHALIEEIGEINRQLIETVVEISEDDVDPTAVAAAAEGEGIIVKCSFSAVALSPNLKSQYASAQMSPIQPLRLLIPTNYPNSSPILLDKFPVAASKEYEYLSMKAKSKYSISLRTLSQPMSLSEMARTWDVCARAVVSEFAHQSGGGTFSAKYGTWESLTTA